jgi:predicted dehydrogenase
VIRRRFAGPVALVLLAAMGPALGTAAEPTPPDVCLMTLDPGHFHAALMHKEMWPGVSPRAYVYAPLGPDLLGHLQRMARFNSRPENPTAWELRIYAGPDALGRMLVERPGNVVVLSGRNREKIGRLLASVEAGLHVLADKPWIIEAAHLPLLEGALDAAARRGVVAYDAMTQRFEVSCLLQKELVQAPDVFGTPLAGSEAEPAVRMESLHHMLKEVAGAAALRPAWFFDVAEQGEGLTDVGTHLVDLVPWTLWPGQPIDYRTQVQVLRARRWPTVLARADFQRVTGGTDFPANLAPAVKDGSLTYYCNTSVHYTVRGVHVRLDIRWDFQAPPGAGDTERAVFRGSRSRVEVHQGKDENFVPELYVVPNRPEDKAAVAEALRRKVDALQAACPGVAVEDEGKRLRVAIPAALRVGHEAHFALLAARFLGYVRNPRTLPAWEKPNMLAKYYVTTRGVELARRGGDPAKPQGGS